MYSSSNTPCTYIGYWMNSDQVITMKTDTCTIYSSIYYESVLQMVISDQYSVTRIALKTKGVAKLFIVKRKHELHCQYNNTMQSEYFEKGNTKTHTRVPIIQYTCTVLEYE